MSVIKACGTSGGGSFNAVPTTAATASTRPANSSFCHLFEQDADTGRLRNWNLTENGKTPSYAETLRGLADAAPSGLKPGIEVVLSYYESAQPSLSPSEYQAAMQSGQRVLQYVQTTCRINTASPPPGDTQPRAP